MDTLLEISLIRGAGAEAVLLPWHDQAGCLQGTKGKVHVSRTDGERGEPP